jgi:hypothetical protein
MNIYQKYLELEEDRKVYYRQYTYRQPFFISFDTNIKMKFIQKCMVQCIRHMVLNYQKFQYIMPLTSRAQEILEICNKFPYNPGTYRTDFIITHENEIKLIEISCRFALNGYIRSGFVNSYAEDFAKQNNIPIQFQYSDFYKDLQNYFGNYKRVIILNDDAFNEGKYFKIIFANAGYDVQILSINEIGKSAHLIKNAICITQMRHDELYSLPNDAIEAMMQGCLLNDLRTVIIPHDKRFFALLYNDEFRTSALGEELAAQFKNYLTPTYSPTTHSEIWESLPDSEQNWIIKPTVLGMSLGITASNSVSKQEWRKSLTDCDKNNIIFQPYLKQRRFNGLVGDEIRTMDYVAGTLLFFQDKFYGPGFFRASNHAVTNQGDDRKIAASVLAVNTNELSEEILHNNFFL